MKRFIMALIVLALLITSSILLNVNISHKSEEIINSDNEKEIKELWSKNQILFNIALSEELVKPLETSVMKLNKNLSEDEIRETKINIRISAEKIKSGTKLTLENIF